MPLVITLGLLSVLFVTLRPLRIGIKQPFAAFASKAFASMFYCLAGIAAAAQRERLNWQAAALLFGFCLAAVGDILLAIEPVLEQSKRDRNYAFAAGAAPMTLCFVIDIAVFLSLYWQLPWPLVVSAVALFVCSGVMLLVLKRNRFSEKFTWLVYFPYYLAQALMACLVAIL